MIPDVWVFCNLKEKQEEEEKKKFFCLCKAKTGIPKIVFICAL